MLDQSFHLASSSLNFQTEQTSQTSQVPTHNPNLYYTYIGSSKRFIWRKNHPDEKSIGKGYTSIIYKGLDLEKEDAVAVKVVPKQKQRLLASETYYRALYHRLPKFPHPNILKLRDFVEDNENYYIISDLYKGSDLVDYVLQFAPRSIPPQLIQSIMTQILNGIDHLHRNKFLHRDIKLDNILFKDASQTQIAIVDYDMSLMTDWHELPKQPKAPNQISIVGTRDYMAPEGYSGVYTEASDLWSVGVILYIFLDGHFPYDLSKGGSQNIKDILKRGIKIRPQVQAKYPLAADLARRLLTYNVNYRIKSAKEALSHPWLSVNSIYASINSANSAIAYLRIPVRQRDQNEQNSVTSHSTNPSYYTIVDSPNPQNINYKWEFFSKVNKNILLQS